MSTYFFESRSVEDDQTESTTRNSYKNRNEFTIAKKLSYDIFNYANRIFKSISSRIGQLRTIKLKAQLGIPTNKKEFTIANTNEIIPRRR